MLGVCKLRPLYRLVRQALQADLAVQPVPWCVQPAVWPQGAGKPWHKFIHLTFLMYKIQVTVYL